MFRNNLPELIGRTAEVVAIRVVLQEERPSITKQINPITENFIEVIFLTFFYLSR